MAKASFRAGRLLAIGAAVGCGPADGGGTGAPPLGIEVRFLAVGGFRLTRGDDVILTAPLYSNPDFVTMTFGEIAPSRERVDAHIPDVSRARAILVGHGHYDHLLDVPYVRTLTDDALVYGNTSVRDLLAGFAPNAPECPAPPPWALVPPDRVVALDDPAADVVDYDGCAGVDTCAPFAPGARGAWVDIPRTRARLRAICSDHPPQLGDFHFGEGCVEGPACGPVGAADAWREGTTLAFLVDFLDEHGDIAARVYAQDAPTDRPVGYPPPDLLAERRVDVALLNAGNYDQVRDHPGEFVRAVNPRFVVMGHWEDFFQPLVDGTPVAPLPGLELEDLESRLEEVLPGQRGRRYWIPLPGDALEL